MEEQDSGAEESTWPDPPTHNFEKPQEVFRISASSIERQGGESSKKADQCFWRKVVWSPDGTHLLAQSDDHYLDLFQLRQTAISYELVKVFSIRAPTTLLSFEWYPFARYEEGVSWCFAISARDVPTRLVDAYEGRTRASYGIINHVERFIGPQILAFSLDGTRLYCALDAEVATFDLANPGINTHTSLKLTPTRRAVSKGKASAGQRGQISCLAVVQDHFAGTSEELLAIATFSGTVGIYKMGSSNLSAEERCLMGWDEASAGVTQIAFHPGAPHIFFVNSRRSNQIRAYDLQYVGSRRSFLHPPSQVSLLATFDRVALNSKESQQRFGFHVDWAGRYLIAGDAEGKVQIWNITQPSGVTSSQDEEDAEMDFFGKVLRDGQQAMRSPVYRFRGADDAVASVMFHPTFPLIAVASGARHWSSDEGEQDDAQEYHTRDGSLRLYVTG